MESYGLIYQSIMRDTELTATAKLIYAYFCSFADKDGMCYPSVDLTIKELGISKNTFYKHSELLKQKGILQTSQVRIGNGRYGKTFYKINHVI